MDDDKKAVKRGLFITFEGPEGAGKSTQVVKLLEYLRSCGISAVSTREPGGTALAEQIRDVVKGHRGEEKMCPHTELLLMEAARSQHARIFIRPHLESGVTVICDRYTDSTLAYQGGARGISKDEIVMLNAFASGNTLPDLTFLLDLSPEAGFSRTRKRQETAGEFDRFEAEKIDFHLRVRRSFLELAAEDPARVRVIDADQTPEAVHSDIVKVINEFIQSV